MQEVTAIKHNGNTIWEKTEPIDFFYIKNVSSSSGTVRLYNDSGSSVNINYSFDGENWNTFNAAVTVQPDEMIYFKGNNPNGFGSSFWQRSYFRSSFDSETGGYITSLLYSDNYKQLSNISLPDYAFSRLFIGDTTLVSADKLVFSQITSIGVEAFKEMFSGCSALMSSPDLTSITSVGEYGCSQMYTNCSSLTSIYAPTVVWDTNKFYQWAHLVSASGIFYASSSIVSTIPAGTSGVPSGWTITNI